MKFTYDNSTDSSMELAFQKINQMIEKPGFIIIIKNIL